MNTEPNDVVWFHYWGHGFRLTGSTSHNIDYVNSVMLAEGRVSGLVSFILVFLTVYTVDCALAGKADVMAEANEPAG